jgi:PTH1 family peptidyl-tRNA hydrolase
MRLSTFFKYLFFRDRSGLEKSDFIVFGLGNPGRDYVNTRHNIGFRIVDRLVSSLENTTRTGSPKAEIFLGHLYRTTATAAVKPRTFMNRSGEAVSEVLKKCNYHTRQQKYVVVVDDVNIPFGSLRIRGKGTHGGHNGLRSIIDTVGTEFVRLRVGIGPVVGSSGMIDFVLGNFSEEEEEQIPDIIAKGCEILKNYAVESLSTVMNTYN